MKKIKLSFWVFSGLLAAGMLFSALSTFLNPAATKKMMSKHLCNPEYFAPLLSKVKILGIIAILIPSFAWLKERACAGFGFDLIGATYSSMSAGNPANDLDFMFVFIILVISII